MMRFSFLLVVSLLLAPSLWAQKGSTLLPTATRGYVVSSDPSNAFNYRRVPDGRIDTDYGVLRAAYRIKATGPELASPEQTARAWMQQKQAQFGWTTTVDLTLLEEVETPYSTHLTFQQTLAGLPVHRRFVKVNLGTDNLPTMVLSDYASHLQHVNPISTMPGFSATQARGLAHELIAPGGALSRDPELVIYPTDPPLLTWRMVVWVSEGPGEWEVMIDAQSGNPIYVLDLVLHHHHPEHDTTATIRRVDGEGMVWIPDPLTSAGASHGFPYSDQNDADVSELNDERTSVTLPDIEQGSDGLYRLQGPYVDIVGNILTPYSPPALTSPDAFNYTRSNDHFEAVMAYYHIDRSQRYVQSLNIGRDIQGAGVKANPHGEGSMDNSAYYYNLNAVSFGDGGIDDAEDAEVIWHEYGHALLYGSAPYMSGIEQRALHEGWSDYWAASFTRGLMEDGSVPSGEWRKVFKWDGNETWNGRFLRTNAVYPTDFGCAVGGTSFCNIYADGVVWATTMMDVYTAIGKELTDELNLASHGYLSGGVTFTDAAEAILQADTDRNQGVNISVISPFLIDRGFISCVGDDIYPFHQPTDGTVVNSPSPFKFLLEVKTCSENPLPLPEIHYSIDGGAWMQETMNQGDTEELFSYEFLIPYETEQVAYYFEITSPGGVTSTLPTEAPNSTFTLDLIEDVEAPVISHNYLTHVTEALWPPEIVATIYDDTEITRAWVEFSVQKKGGSVGTPQTFFLSPISTEYIGYFPALDLEVGDRVHYRIVANDNAVSTNTGILPPRDDPAFVIHLIRPGILADYDAEYESGITTSGSWGRSAPSYGLMFSHTGQLAWRTNADGPYSAQSGISSLEIPQIDLINFPDAVLIFWHWYDFEHTGLNDLVGSPGSTAYDGGNVKFSVDGGGSWEVLDGLYTSSLHSTNPMEGEPAFAGYGYGWRRAEFTLPHMPQVSLRIDFATGNGNSHTSSHSYAGWAVDDIRILVESPTEEAPPVIVEQPDPRIRVDAGQSFPTIRVKATDNTGIQDLLAKYTIEPSGGNASTGTLRLAMDTSDRTLFSGSFPAPSVFQWGDRLKYQIEIWDFNDNVTKAPEEDGPLFVIEALYAEQLPTLARATTSGHWKSDNRGGYRTVAGGSAQISSIIMVPEDLPTNVEEITLLLDHTLRLAGARGNVKLSTNNGEHWEVFHPYGGYPETFQSGGSHPMRDEQVFSSSLESTTRFDLTEYAGQRVWLRIDLGSIGSLGNGEYWEVRSSLIESTTRDEVFARNEPALELYSNFPDPFFGHTTINYSLPEEMRVHISVFNMLGQEVQVLSDETQAAGIHSLGVNLSGLAGGVYFLRLRAGRHTLLEPLLVTR